MFVLFCSAAVLAVVLYCYNKIEISQMDDDKLIEYARKYPAIYDMSHPKYLDNSYKLSLWKKVSSSSRATAIAANSSNVKFAITSLINVTT